MAILLPFHFPLSSKLIEQAVACVQAGGVLAIPTDSFYALAVGVFQPSALERLLRIKGGREGSPIPVLVGDVFQVESLTKNIPDVAIKLMQEFWPGLLTLVLGASPRLSPILTGGKNTIGVRQPNDPRVCELLKHTGPLTGTSANRTGQPPARSGEEVMQQIGSDIDLILDGGPTPGGQPSTVLQVAPETRILREGAISFAKIKAVFA
ncbi:MAG: L-threonylcarbamoyladenylate synthase [Nitrospirales bacterium]